MFNNQYLSKTSQTIQIKPIEVNSSFHYLDFFCCFNAFRRSRSLEHLLNIPTFKSQLLQPILYFRYLHK
jgi:hypothetical protein